jgi:coronatine-insensitive protein 1
VRNQDSLSAICWSVTEKFVIAGGGWSSRSSRRSAAAARRSREEEEERREGESMAVQYVWRKVDGNTRKYVTIANMYVVAPTALTKRFNSLDGIKLKGKPRAAEYNLLLPDWGGHAGPWLEEFGAAYDRLRTLQLRCVEVRDADLHLLSLAPFSATLQVMHLHKCSGFTTRGLLPISRSCR